MNKRPWKRRLLSPGWLMFFSALLCVALVPVVQAALRYSSDTSERYRQLTELTESERLKIQHSFEEFQKLSPAEQESYRELDRRLNDEDLKLKDTLASYQEFLSTLSPVDRAKVERATTKRKRLMVIDQIQKERADLRQQLEAGYSMLEERFRSSESDDDRPPAFSAAEMEAITELLEDRMPNAVRQKYNLEAKTGTVRFAWAVIAALDVWKGSPRSNRERELFPEDLREEIVSATQNSEIRQSFEEARHNEHHTFTRAFLGLSFWTVLPEHLKSSPDISELSELLNTLDEEEKKKLMSKDPKWMYRDLKREYFKKNPNDISTAFYEMGDKIFRGWPGRGGGPKGRHGDDRDGDDDDRHRFNRNGDRSSRDGEQGDFGDGRRGRGFRDGGSGERFGDERRPEPEPESSAGSD